MKSYFVILAAAFKAGKIQNNPFAPGKGAAIPPPGLPGMPGKHFIVLLCCLRKVFEITSVLYWFEGLRLLFVIDIGLPKIMKPNLPMPPGAMPPGAMGMPMPMGPPMPMMGPPGMIGECEHYDNVKKTIQLRFMRSIIMFKGQQCILQATSAVLRNAASNTAVIVNYKFKYEIAHGRVLQYYFLFIYIVV